MQKKTRARKVCDVFRAILSQSNSLRSLEACADVHNKMETTRNWEGSETQGTTACNLYARAPSKRLPRVRTTDHKRTSATLQSNGLQDRITHVQLYSSPIAVHVKTLLHVLGEHFLHRFELTKSPMYVHISFRNCVLANRTLFMAMTRGEERGLTVTTACIFSHVPPWPVPAACDQIQGVALSNRLTH